MKTAECVTPGHPDKMCDRISDAVLDWALKNDPKARVAIEVLGGHGRIFICGELTMLNMPSDDDLQLTLVEIVQGVTGRTDLQLDWNIVKQSPEIANGVDTGGAGDQGIMVGYACDDNEAMIPEELFLARSLAKFLYEKFPFDGKTQVTLDNNNDVITIVASFQNVDKATLEESVNEWVEKDGIYCTPDVNIYANPAGDWKQGGFDADTGLTGRKLMVDNYGPQVAIGGGCFSGKDASKVDRSAAYMARRIAVDLLKEHKAHNVTVKLAYAIGVAEPVMATACVDIGSCTNDIEIKGYDLTPKGIREFLKLDSPQYEETAKWGHFGNGFVWDK